MNDKQPSLSLSLFGFSCSAQELEPKIGQVAQWLMRKKRKATEEGWVEISKKRRCKDVDDIHSAPVPKFRLICWYFDTGHSAIAVVIMAKMRISTLSTIFIFPFHEDAKKDKEANK